MAAETAEYVPSAIEKACARILYDYVSGLRAAGFRPSPDAAAAYRAFMTEKGRDALVMAEDVFAQWVASGNDGIRKTLADVRAAIATQTGDKTMGPKKYAVLDDNTRDAWTIGHAATPEEAATVWREYYRSRMDPEDFAELMTPGFYLRHDGTPVSPEPAFEPI